LPRKRGRKFHLGKTNKGGKRWNTDRQREYEKDRSIIKMKRIKKTGCIHSQFS
jgi:hypothetical protein